MVFRGEAYYSDTDYPAADECLDVKIGMSIATEVAMYFWQINVFHQNWIAEKFPISINWHMFTSGVSQPHTLSTASVALVQTDTWYNEHLAGGSECSSRDMPLSSSAPAAPTVAP